MESIIPSRSARQLLRLRKWILALAVALAAMLLPASGAFADLENQKEVDKAVADFEKAVTQARDNIPGNRRVSRAENARDAAHRAEANAREAIKAAKQAADAARANFNRSSTDANLKTAQIAAANVLEKQGEAKKAADAAKVADQDADDLREEMKDKSSEEQKDRAQKYREALDKRRAATEKMRELEAQMRGWLRARRATGDSQELDRAINRLQERIGDSGDPIPPRTVTGLKLFQSTKANVATDSQKNCTYGKASPMSVAFEPSDGDGNPLREKLDAELDAAMAALKRLFPDATAPINISNPDPDNAPKQDKPGKGGAGPTTATGGPQAGGDGAPGTKSPNKADATSTPPAGPATSGPPAGPTAVASGPAASAPSETTPKRPADTGLTLRKLPTGEWHEDAIDRFIKLAAEARDKASFESYRGAVQALTQEIMNNHKPEGGVMHANGQLWQTYYKEVSAWQFQPKPETPAATPGAAAGQTAATPASAAATAPPAGPPALASGPAASAPSASETTPKRPADTGLFGHKLESGEWPEDAIDRFSKLAEEALTKGDKASFELNRAEVLASTQWVLDRNGPVFLYSRGEPPEKNLRARWRTYYNEVSGWQFEARPEAAAATPEAATGTPSGTPAPATVESKPAATPGQSAAPGGKSAPAPEKSKSSEKAEPGDKSAPAVEKSNQKAETGGKSAPAPEKSNLKAEPIDKTPSSSAAAYPEQAAGNTIHITIHFKVTETALQGGPQDNEIITQTPKLTALEPALPKTGQTKTVKAKLDKGYDKSPVTCTTGADGRCKVQLPPDERESYGLPALPTGAELQDKPAGVADGDPLHEFVRAHSANLESQNYSVGLSVPKITGMVIQKEPAKFTSAQLAALADSPPGVQIEKASFKIGGKTFTRVGLAGPEAITAALAKKFADLFGKDVQIDFCIDKAPGPPLGMTPVSFSALNNELPQAAVNLHRSAGSEGTRR